MNRNQTQELLVESKGQLINNKEDNQKLLSKIKLLENENEELVGEIESTKIMLYDIQTKYNMVEKNVMFNADRNTDKILKEAQERNSAQTAKMQQEIDRLKSKYDELEHEHKHLDIRYKELQRSREGMLIEKSEMINHLNRNLEESQRQCQELLSRQDFSQENMRLQNAIRTVEYQKNEMSMTISKLQKKLQEQTAEIEAMDSVLHECSGNNQSFAEISNFVNRDPLKNKNINNSTPIATELRHSKMKDELCKSLQNIKIKREEIKILEKQLIEKDNEITEMKKDESKLLVDLNKYKDEVFRLESKMSIMQEELEKTRHELKKIELKNVSSTESKIEQDHLVKELDGKTQECEELVTMLDNMKLNEIEIYRKLEAKEENIVALTDELKETCKKNDENAAKVCEMCQDLESKIQKVFN